MGRILDEHGNAISNATVEIWQYDAVFFESRKEICDVKLVSWDFVSDPLTEGKCLLTASNLCASVKRYGEEYYRVDNSTYCEYRFPAEDDMDTSGLVGLLLKARRPQTSTP